MSDGWAIRVPRKKAAGLAELRLTPKLLVCEADGYVWLRGDDLSESLHLALRMIPAAERFSVGAAQGTASPITPIGKRVPVGVLPTAVWKPIASWFQPMLAPPALAGEVLARQRPRLLRAEQEMLASVLMCRSDDWYSWAIAAPLVRLNVLYFAASDDGRIVVRSKASDAPLPPIPGRRYVENGGIAVPAGLRLEPALDAAAWRTLLGTTLADLVVFDDDGTWERIPGEGFVAATRSAARATKEATATLALSAESSQAK